MPSDKSLRIMIAEDDDADFDLLLMIFEEHFPQAELIRSIDGDDILKKLSESPLPEAVILDLNMPRKDGRQTLQEIKSDVRLRDVPTIIFTTSNFADDRELVTKLNGIYVTKSFSLNDSIEFVKQLARAIQSRDFSEMA